jgi:hypothetical protein
VVPAGNLLVPVMKLAVLVGAEANGVVAYLRRAAELQRSRWAGLAAKLEQLAGVK